MGKDEELSAMEKTLVEVSRPKLTDLGSTDCDDCSVPSNACRDRKRSTWSNTTVNNQNIAIEIIMNVIAQMFEQ